ncbi:MAG: toxic anion resistance protein [Gammaproteobacteria bacterium]|nr:toxic anion resistance protein [Gammaproteobacteria bacterium]
MSNPDTTENASQPQAVQLTPPADLELTAPQPVQPVAPESAAGRVKLKPGDVAELDAQVRAFIDAMTGLDEQDPKFKDCLDRIHSMGNKDVEQSAGVANRLLERPVKTLKNGLFDSGSDISQALVDLRTTVEKLDPSSQGDLFAPRKLLGLIPFGNRLNEYFDQYRSSQSHLNAIVETLRRGKDELLRDNAAIEQEKVNLWILMERLEKYIYLGKKLDAALDAKARTLEATDAQKARVVREELLFYTRQKVTDLLTQMAVNIQGYLALDLLRKNNFELIKGVDRATTTTVAALRTAVMVAQALVNQKLVLDQISALNATTGNIIETTSEMLKKQTGEIHQQAASSTIEVDKLRKAFANVHQTMDAIADFKSRSLESMQKTVDALSGEVAKARTYLDRVRKRESAAALTVEAGEVRL